MKTLAHNRLYSREAVLRAMTAAGQFAHLSPEQIEAEVAILYDERRPWHEQGPLVRDTIERAVPRVLMMAHRDGFMARQCYDGEVINWVALRSGVTCCLCLDVDMPDGRFEWVLPNGFLADVCPTFLAISGVHEIKAAQPACRACRRSLAGYFWRTYGIRGPRGDDAWSAALAWLLLNPNFRERVVMHADNIDRLRFDPRRQPERRAA